jgi:calcium/calmodulin-dependent protein kinase I
MASYISIHSSQFAEMSLPVSNMLNKLHGQPETYDKKYVPQLDNCPARADNNRSKYKFGRTLGAGTYGIVREAEGPDKKKVAIKIILKKNIKGNEQMVVDELRMLREMKHPHIVQFVDWFESRVRYIVSMPSARQRLTHF